MNTKTHPSPTSRTPVTDANALVKDNVFNNFTNKYALSKTLRFELVPTEKTKELLNENNIFEIDEKRAEAYQEIKPLFDNLHREFIKEALDHENIKVTIFHDFAKKYKEIVASGKKDWKALRDAKSPVYTHIADVLDGTGNAWRERYGKTDDKAKKENAFKSTGFKVLTDAHILNVLAERNPDKKVLIESFKGFFTYFDGFNNTRENFYKDDGTATAVATRVADNLIPFLANISDFNVSYVPHKKELALTQEEIALFDIDVYAGTLLQSDVEAYNKAIGDLNRRMKILRDEHQKDADFKKSHYPLLRTLDNQILGERTKKLFVEQIKDEKDALERLSRIVPLAHKRFAILKKLFASIHSGKLSAEDEQGIYLNNRAINTLSRRYLNDALTFENDLPQRGGKKDPEGSRIAYFVSLADIRVALEKQENEFVFKDETADKKVPKEKRLSHFLSLLHAEFSELFQNRTHGKESIVGFDDAYENMAHVLKVSEKELRSKKNRETIKEFFDAGIPISQMGKYFSLATNNKRGAEAPASYSAEFYNTYNDDYVKEFDFAKQFDLFRNYISRKPGDDENKVKLNFGKGNLLGGWAESPVGNAQFQGYILRKGGDYYLGITTDSHFLDIEKYSGELKAKSNDDVYEKLEYFQLDWGKNIVGGQVYTSYTKQKLGEKLSFQEHKVKVKSQKEHVAFIKTLIREKYLERYGFLNDFLEQDFATPKDMQIAFAKLPTSGMKFVKVCASRIDCQSFKKSNDKDALLYLFRISNKDLRNHKGIDAKNVHSHYWNALFSETNLKKDMHIKLLGGAEVFLRRGKIEELKEREVKNRKKWKGAVLEHRRYAEDKQFFHVPVQINAQAPNPPTQKRFNEEINALLSAHPEMCVIGIDRGEKHLLYYSVINGKGEILEQGSMNSLEVAGKPVDFQSKLVELEKARLKDRKSWAPVRGIKDLKKGYVSHAVHKVVQLVEKYQAIVVLEDLNMRFKQVRGGVERSVYQQFEKGLINKLGYLVMKNRSADAIGGVMRGYQLAAPFESFEKLGKQTGILFYTQADYTSITDPLTGFRKNVYVSNSATVAELKKTFTDKITIGWDEKRQSYTFTYDQADFVKDKKSKVASKKWTVYADVPRIRRTKENGYWQYKLVNPNEMLEELFKLWDIQNPHEGTWDKIMEAPNLSEQKDIDGRKRGFWHALIYIFNLILQTRNSSSQVFKKNEKGELVPEGEDADFIASPIQPFFRSHFKWEGKEYPAQFGGFESRVVGENKKAILNTFNGDANGAYNIARKGLIILKKVKDREQDLFIPKEEWDTWAANN